MAKLAIKGHPTRGNEVIEILEMLGGNNEYNKTGSVHYEFYYIGHLNRICSLPISESYRPYVILTLEEFFEKFPYKVGDKVHNIVHKENQIITNLIWDSQENEVEYQTNNNEYVYVNYLQPYKEETMEEIKIDIPAGYEFAGVDDNAQQVVFTKIQPQYPKTYEECCEVLAGRKPNPNEISFDKMELCLVDLDDTQNIDFKTPQLLRLNGLFKLLMCRNAYWKIAGGQMGLDKPWEPDWLNLEQDKYVLYTHNNVICSNRYLLGHNVLAFPTKEMRDAFYEDFKDLIEECKELL